MSTGRFRKAFSLLEVIIVLFLIAAVSAVLVANFDSLIRGFQQKSLREVFYQALREGRYQAGFLKEPCTLRFDKEKANFVILSQSEKPLATFPTNLPPDDVFFEMTLILPNPDPQGSLEFKLEDHPTPSLYISPLGYTPPVSIEFKENKETQALILDPFSTTVLPMPKDREENPS